MMNDIWTKQALALSKQFTDNTAKAQNAAMKGYEQIMGAQMKAFEQHADAFTGYAEEAGNAKDIEDVRTLWTQGIELARESAEKAYATHQEIVGITLKTSQTLGDLAREQIKAGGDAAAAAPANAKKAARKAA